MYMLLNQLRRSRFSFPKIKPKVDVAGVGLEVELNSQAKQDLIEDTLRLLEIMEKKDLLKSLLPDSKIDSDVFWRDEGLWFNGLFTFRATPDIVSYFLWKTHGDSIILLVGSPLHILGDKIIREGVFAPGTSAAWRGVIDFVDLYIRPDESVLVFDPSRDVGFTFLSKEKTYQDELEELPLKMAEFDVAPDTEIRDVATELFSRESIVYMSGQRALSLGILCLKYLSRLPQSRVDTVFKVFFEDSLEVPEDLPKWFSTLSGISEDLVAQLGLEKYRRVYIGSPIYTALL